MTRVRAEAEGSIKNAAERTHNKWLIPNADETIFFPDSSVLSDILFYIMFLFEKMEFNLCVILAGYGNCPFDSGGPAPAGWNRQGAGGIDHHSMGRFSVRRGTHL